MMFRRRKFATEVELIAHRAHLRCRILSHALALTFTWLVVVLAYAVSMRILFTMGGPDFMAWWMDESFMLFYGVGMVAATLLLPLFELLFLMDDASDYRREKSLLIELAKRETPSWQVKRY
jgi:hypothetical protein